MVIMTRDKKLQRWEYKDHNVRLTYQNLFFVKELYLASEEPLISYVSLILTQGILINDSW